MYTLNEWWTRTIAQPILRSKRHERLNKSENMVRHKKKTTIKILTTVSNSGQRMLKLSTVCSYGTAFIAEKPKKKKTMQQQ